MRNTKFIIAFIFILALGGFLYFHKLELIPNGLYVDEAVTGYNAYSLLKTGKDEYGKAYPVALRFLGSYSPPLYTYLSIPIVAINGLSIFSTRIVSSISGLLSILLVFHFLKALKITKSKWTPALGALLFAISPWTVFYSRVGYELYLAFFAFALGVFFVWQGLKKPKLLIHGFALLSLSTYTAHPEQILTPIFIVGITVFFRKELLAKKSKKYFLAGLFIAGLIQLPYLTIISSPALFSKTSLFYKGVVFAQAEKIAHFLPTFIAFPLSFLREFLSQYLTYFSPRSLFFLPDPDPQRGLPELSVFYSWMIIPYFVGVYLLLKGRKKRSLKFILLLCLLAPLPAALAGDPFSTQRALPLLLPLSLIITLGVDRLIYKARLKVWLATLIGLLTLSFLLLWRSYFVLLPNERAKTWGYGFKQLAEEIKKRPNDKFLIDQSRIKPAYVELAFFLKYPPEQLHKEIDQSIKDNYYTKTVFSPHYQFANIETRNINWEKDIYTKQIIVGDELAISENQAKEHFLNIVFEIRSPLDEVVFQAYETNPQQKCAKIFFKNPLCVN